MSTTTSPLDSTLARSSQGDGFQSPDRNLQDEWARQLAAMLTAPAAPNVLLPEGEAPSAPSIGDRSATNYDTVDLFADDGHSDAVSDKRLTLTVRTSELGEVTIVIDRASKGVRVVLGVQAGQAGRALDAEKSALLSSLRAVGLDVHSVSVVHQNEVGTVLALDRDARNRPRLPDDTGEAPRGPRKHGTLKLIG